MVRTSCIDYDEGGGIGASATFTNHCGEDLQVTWCQMVDPPLYNSCAGGGFQRTLVPANATAGLVLPVSLGKETRFGACKDPWSMGNLEFNGGEVTGQCKW